MLSVDNKNNITISHGDTFFLSVVSEGSPFEIGSKITLSIKQYTKIIKSIETTIEDDIDKIDFVIPAEDMSELSIGDYIYDVHIVYPNDTVYTTSWVHDLKIVKTAH